MKLRFLINSLAPGGAERVLNVIVNKLSQLYDVEVICLEKKKFYEMRYPLISKEQNFFIAEWVKIYLRI